MPQRNDRALERGSKPKGEAEVLDRNIRGHEIQNDESEVNNVIPTGNLTEEEHRLLLRYQDLLSDVRSIEDRLDIDLPVKKELVQKINFFVHSSKSIEGFGIEKIATKEIRENQTVRHERGRDEGGSWAEMIRQELGQGGAGGETRFVEPNDDLDAW